jgi:NADH:ubiquinone oxidoreductase subunit 3 (subunit A)
LVLRCVTVVLVLFLILVGAGVALGFNSLNTREKLSSYECGYEPLGRDGLNFCFRFFVLAVVFIIFDVELVLVIYFIVLGVAGNLWFLK